MATRVHLLMSLSSGLSVLCLLNQRLEELSEGLSWTLQAIFERFENRLKVSLQHGRL